MEKPLLGPIPVLLGLLLLVLIFLVLVDIKNALRRIEEHLKEVNEADPHVANQRYLRENDIGR